MSGTFGPTSGRLFATYDHESRSWKMFPATGLWGSIEYSETWPRTGCMCDGQAFELPMSVPHTSVSVSSSLLPTPDAYEAKRGGSQHPNKRRAGGHSPYLASVVEHLLLPTPRHTDHYDSLTTPASRKHVQDGNGTLPETIGYKLLPTARGSDAEKGGPNQRGSRGDLMLPSAASSIGANTSRQSDPGSESQGDMLPDL